MSVAARRLAIPAAGWAVLAAGRLPGAPRALAPAALGAAEREAATTALLADGVLAAPGDGPVRPVPAVAADLAVLARPLLTVRLEVAGPVGERAGWFALGAGVVVGVLSLPGGGVELSVAPAARLGAELARAVPEVGAVSGAPAAGGVAAPSGRLAVTELDRELGRRTGGALDCLVLGRVGSGAGAGQVSWLATDAGWVGLRPCLGEGPARLVDLVPVQPADLGSWIAPTVAALLEAPGGR
ncbi:MULTISPECIES: hypothetical protein [unclassified Blastococcus]